MQSLELVNTMLDVAITKLKENEKTLIHSDRGAHYHQPGWFERMEYAESTRSMSKKGCSPDNSACEGGRLKNEMFYGRKQNGAALDDFINILIIAAILKSPMIHKTGAVKYLKKFGVIAA